jgi:hypothetical protein
MNSNQMTQYYMNKEKAKCIPLTYPVQLNWLGTGTSIKMFKNDIEISKFNNNIKILY